MNRSCKNRRRCRRVLGAIAAVLLTRLTSTDPALGQAVCGQNLLLNPGCEQPLVSGNIPGWIEVAGTGWTQRFADPPPYAGTAYFFPGAIATAELAQSVDVTGLAGSIDVGVQRFTFSGRIRTFPQTPSDLARIVVEYRAANGTTVLTSFDSGNLSNVNAWQAVADFRTAPIGTRFVRIRLISTRSAGSNNDGYYDGLSLIAECGVPSVFPRPKMLLHVMSTTTKNLCDRANATSCESAIIQGALYPSLYFAYVLVVGLTPAEGISGVQFGFQYTGPGASDGVGIDIYGTTLCGTLEFQSPTPAWPNSGGGNLITFGSCERFEPVPGSGVVANAMYFYMTAYTPGTLSITPRPVDNRAAIADCEANEFTLDHNASPSPLGKAGFGGQPGYRPSCENFLVVGAPAGPPAPRAFDLSWPSPNPFRSLTTIRYRISESGPVRVSIHDVRGRRIAELVERVDEAGEHSVRWDGRSDSGTPVPAGVYFVQLSVRGEVLTKKVEVVR